MADETNIDPKKQQWPNKGRIDYFDGETVLDTGGSFEDTMTIGYRQRDKVQSEYELRIQQLGVALRDGFSDDESPTEDSEDGGDVSPSDETSPSTSGGIGGRPDFIPEKDWEIVLKYCDGVNVDPYLIAAMGKQETQWGKAGLGKKGYTLGMGATESGNVSYMAGLESQVKEVASRLKALKDCAGHMLGEQLDEIESPWTGHKGSMGATKGPRDLVWIQTGAKPGGKMAGRGVAGKRPWSKDNGVYGYHTGHLKHWYTNVKKVYLELKETVGTAGVNIGPGAVGSGKDVTQSEAQKFYDELYKLVQDGDISVNNKARKNDIKNGNISLALVQVLLYITQVKKVKMQIGCLNSGHPVISSGGGVGRHKYCNAFDASRVNGHHIETKKGLDEFKKVVDALAEISSNGTGNNGWEFFGPTSLCAYYKKKDKKKVPMMCKWISGHTNHIHVGLPKKFFPKNYMNTLWDDKSYEPKTEGTKFYSSLVWDKFSEYEEAIGRTTATISRNIMR